MISSKQIPINLCQGVSCTIRHNPGVMSPSNVITPPIIVATIKDRKPTYSTKVCQTIRSNSHGAIPHFLWIERQLKDGR